MLRWIKSLPIIPSTDPTINLLTLSFKDKALEKLFNIRYLKSNLRYSRVCHVLSIIFYILVGVWDVLFIDQTKLTIWLYVSSFVTAVFLTGLTISFKAPSFYLKYWKKMFVLYVLVTGIGFTVISLYNYPNFPTYNFLGLVFCLLFCYAIIHLTFVYAAFAGNLIVIIYFAVSLFLYRSNHSMLLTSFFYTMGINLLGMIVCYAFEVMARRDFVLNKMLKEAEQKTKEINNTLESMVEERTKALQKTQEELLHAQKMESIGRLAGGVAHDYNNISTIIMGYSELILDKLDPESPLRSDINEIHNAVQRASEITRQLLTFARKQPVKPKVIDLNALVGDMIKMLERLIGENITLEWKPCEKTWPIKIDPTQIDQVLINLCVNSREAIENNGTITIETRNLTIDEDSPSSTPEATQGNYIVLSVTDDGSGMDTEILSKVFEPFFTTRANDKGTGLGLSTVYGIVKQNGGFARIKSQVDIGTTISLFFLSTNIDLLEEKKETEITGDLEGNETILIVEDEPSILNLSKNLLESLGYEVHTAIKASLAIEIAKKQGDCISLLLCDVVMPEMNGKKLSEEIERIIPDIKILFMSGYTADVISNSGILDSGISFLHKPFSRKEIALTVRKCLSDKEQ